MRPMSLRLSFPICFCGWANSRHGITDFSLSAVDKTSDGLLPVSVSRSSMTAGNNTLHSC